MLKFADEFTDENGATISFSELLRLADEEGNQTALKMTAPVLFESGNEEDLQKSIKYYKILANEYQVCEAMMFLSFYYRENSDLSFEWLKKAADLNFRDAVVRMAECYQSRYDILNSSESNQEDLDNLIHYSLLASESSDSKSCYYLGQVYENGYLNCEKSVRKALEFYILGSDSSCMLHASNILLNESEFHDKSRAIQLIISSARKFGIPSLKPVADLIIENDPQEAFSLYAESSSQGDPLSTKIVGDCYYFGMGTETNVELSLEYYEKAISLGSKEALLPCLRILWDKKEKSRALELFQTLIKTFIEDQSPFENLTTSEWYERLDNFFF